MKIETEEQYLKTLNWLTAKADELEDPLLKGEAREKLQRNYDHFAAEARKYRLRLLAAEFPGLREVYKTLGWSMGEQPEQQKPGPSWLED